MKLAITILICVLHLVISNSHAESTSLQSLQHASQTKYKADGTDFSFRIPVKFEIDTNSHVKFVGMQASNSATGRPGAVLYSGDAGIAGLLAQIMVHAAIENSVQNSAEAKAQQQADEVLEPYQTMIDSISGSLIVQSCLDLCNEETKGFISFPNADEGPSATPEMTLESHPLFLLTQDRRNIVLRNILILRSVKATSLRTSRRSSKSNPPAQKPNVIYQNVIEIVSNSCERDTSDTCWLEAPTIGNLSGSLFSISMDLGVKDILRRYSNSEETDRTFKYKFGGASSYERGKLLSAESGRLTLRTLRGWIKSVPLEQKNTENPTTSMTSANSPTIEK